MGPWVPAFKGYSRSSQLIRFDRRLSISILSVNDSTDQEMQFYIPRVLYAAVECVVNVGIP